MTAHGLGSSVYTLTGEKNSCSINHNILYNTSHLKQGLVCIINPSFEAFVDECNIVHRVKLVKFQRQPLRRKFNSSD